MEAIAHIHRFSEEVGNIDLPQKFTYPFFYTPHPLCRLAAQAVQDYLAQQTEWQEELQRGKMFGVLVVKDCSGDLGFLAAFSGNLQKSNLHPYFVPPIYDLLQPDGFFKREELEISKINEKIDSIKRSEWFVDSCNELKFVEKRTQNSLDEAKLAMKKAKEERDRRRSSGVSSEEMESMVRESQFQKAEYRRLEKSLRDELDAVRQKYVAYETEIESLKKERKRRSMDLQMRLFEQFQIRNAKGDVRGLCEIFAPTPQGVPPAGAGECAAPKLLQYAYIQGYKPLAMAEFWWGDSPKTEIRHHLHYYPACKLKCEPILNFMMQGLNVEENPLAKDKFKEMPLPIVYEDDYLLVVDKPAGMLSVPGKMELTSVVDRVKELYPNATGPLVVHRLDMSTSGLLLVAKNEMVHKDLQDQFCKHTIKKCYIALLDGVVPSDEGVISLPLMPDYQDRPRQMVSYEHGKRAVTRYKVLDRKDGRTSIQFFPETGRTHQLRVHSAHKDGLGCPICGDELYGKKSDRLYLHAQQLEFTHPITKERISVVSKSVPF
ncbi:MAG: RNA pseudouridine synthase [Paludibacteraceae bacterium]|nr:RNA pseudouridine synthase [Paludibacteraceae bacterium]